MRRDSFVFYRSFFEAISCLDDKTQLECYQSIAKYALDGEVMDICGASKGMFLSFKPQIDVNNIRYANGCKGAEYGKLGGRPRKNKSGDIDKNPIGVIDKNPKKTPNENENENENVNEKIKEKDKRENRPRFVKPTLEEVKAYIEEKGYQVDAQTFISFYESKGWVVGKSPMKNWRAALGGWESREKKNRPVNRPANKFCNFPQNTYDMDDLEAKLLDN